MEPGLAELLPPLPQEPKVIRVIWRMQGPSRVITAEIHRHPAGRELVVSFDGLPDDVLETRFERLDFSALDRRADELRATLAGKGWVDLREALAADRTP
jgi:hypothetical protein